MKNCRTNQGSKRTKTSIACLVAILLLVGQSAAARSENATTAADAGLGIAAALSSLVYGPLKIVYAVLGGTIGGIAWGLSGGDSEVLGAVLLPAVRGDYVVTPSHLRGEEPLEFIGRRPGYGRETVEQQEIQEDF